MHRFLVLSSLWILYNLNIHEIVIYLLLTRWFCIKDEEQVGNIIIGDKSSNQPVVQNVSLQSASNKK